MDLNNYGENFEEKNMIGMKEVFFEMVFIRVFREDN